MGTGPARHGAAPSAPAVPMAGRGAPHPWARAALRLLCFGVLAVVGTVLAGGLLYTPLSTLAGVADLRVSLGSWFAVAGLLAAHAVCHRVFGEADGWERDGLGDAAWRPGQLARAALAGALVLLVPSLLLLAAGQLRIQPAAETGHGEAILRLAALLVPAALAEELALRGYPLTVLREAFGTRAALLLTSVAFGAVHLLNPAPSLRAVAIVALAGVWLGMLRLATASLPAAWLAHLAFNAAQAMVLHAPVSGLALPTPGWRTVDAGPDWLTGGGWGPEGGAAVAAGMGVVTFLHARAARRRAAQTEPMSRRRAAEG